MWDEPSRVGRAVSEVEGVWLELERVGPVYGTHNLRFAIARKAIAGAEAADKRGVAFSLEQVRAMTGGRRRWVPAALAGFGALIVWLVIAGWLGAAAAVQVVLTLVIPAAIMTGYWLLARERIQMREADVDAALELEQISRRSVNELLSSLAHEMTPHPELCSLRAEALAVAVDFRHLCPDLKVAVPDAVILTDPDILRHVLNVLVGNAVRFGGDRVAIWSSSEAGRVRLSVSDDGPGLPEETADRLFERYVDLAGRGPHPRVSGLSLARTLAELIGSELGYRRDPNWTHFSVLLPAGGEQSRDFDTPVSLGAGAR